MQPHYYFTAYFLLSAFFLSGQPRQYFSETPLFENGQGAYACYRIPAVLQAPSGDLLAFAEGRVNGCSDFGDVDIVLRRSRDDGQSWEPQKVVADNGRLQAGNPAPVVDFLDPDYPQGRIFLFYNTGNNDEGSIRRGEGVREVWFVTSIDGGHSWTEPVNITASVHRPNEPDFNAAYTFEEDWRHYANAPGHALQLREGPLAGRLFIPANHSAGPPQDAFGEYRAHGFYSDDHGRTWHLGATVGIPGSNEAIAVQLSDGRLMMNCRDQSGKSRRRIVALSADGGNSWDSVYFDNTLISPVCQASLLEYTTPNARAALLFSNPADSTARMNMTVRMSYDQGRTWPVRRRIRRGDSAYSDLVVQDDGRIGLLYEHGNNGGIHYARFNYAWLTGGN